MSTYVERLDTASTGIYVLRTMNTTYHMDCNNKRFKRESSADNHPLVLDGEWLNYQVLEAKVGDSMRVVWFTEGLVQYRVTSEIMSIARAE